ncbi:hypothetical protein JZO66_05355 [Enterococcus sp. DIV0242_7C1]|uniref:WxL domain-containing protein n=1 Tax=Candidatus Enterococcus dunnyi TaxID=1834192 RepID=A0A200J0Q4_9ENTE|nr:MULTISPECIES: hypothetical protein [unclassified Enterococcus]MBO0469960.1 hypothetical protein [Enterococcus sp. DIV0242_7C1]OUZ30401.1 hypothetical protein A5889_002689 [Enterococcus sp. 9D6_DIV0238]
MKKRKMLLFILSSLTLLAVLVGIRPEKGYAADLTPEYMTKNGYTYLADMPGVTVIDPANPMEFGYEDSLQLRLNPKTSYEASPEFSTQTAGTGGMKSYTVSQMGKLAGKELWIKVKYAGTYKGKDIDVTFKHIPKARSGVSEGLTFHTPTYDFYNKAIVQSDGYNTTLFPSIYGRSYFLGYVFENIDTKKSDIYEYSWEFSYSETGEPIEVTGLWMHNRINAAKVVTPYEASLGDMYIRNDALLWGRTTTEGQLDITGSRDAVYPTAEPITSLGRMINQKSEIKQSFRTSEWRTANSAGSINFVWPLGENDLVRYKAGIPLVIGERNDATHTEADYTKLKFSVDSLNAFNPKEYRSDSYVMEINVPKGYDIESVKPVLHEDETVDLSDLFEAPVKVSDQKWQIKAKDSTSDEFDGKNIRYQVVAKPNADFVFSDYGYDPTDGYLHLEMGKNSFLSDSLGTSTPTVTLTTTFNGKTTEAKSDITEESMSLIKYEGIPDADPVPDLTVDPNIDIKTVYPDPAELIKNLRVDTDSPLDEITSIKYKETGAITSGSKTGDVTEVIVVITTAQGVSKEIKVPITVGETNSILTIEFIDEDGIVNESKTITIDTLTGTVIDLTKNDDVKAVLTALENDGYKITQRPANEGNITVTSNMTVQYHYSGIVYLASAPDMIDFGTIQFTALDVHVKNPTLTGKDLTVRDTRSSTKKSSWDVKARVTKPMTRVGDTNILKNAIHYQYGDNDIELSETSAETVFKKDKGGDYNISQEWNTDGDGVKLAVAGADAQKTGEYQGEITWSLEAGP